MEHPITELKEDLQLRRVAALNPGSERSVERQHSKGKMLARERIDYLLDPGSFVEMDMLARSRSDAFDEDQRPYGDGVVTGVGNHRWSYSVSV